MTYRLYNKENNCVPTSNSIVKMLSNKITEPKFECFTGALVCEPHIYFKNGQAWSNEI